MTYDIVGAILARRAKWIDDCILSLLLGFYDPKLIGVQYSSDTLKCQVIYAGTPMWDWEVTWQR